MALTDGLLDGVYEPLRRLIVWHSAEELEHRAVAFDVLREVDCRYSLRLAGFAVVSAAMFRWTFLATRLFVVQSGTTSSMLWSDYRTARSLVRSSRFWSKLLVYLRPGFHPDDAGIESMVRAQYELERLLGKGDEIGRYSSVEF